MWVVGSRLASGQAWVYVPEDVGVDRVPPSLAEEAAGGKEEGEARQRLTGKPPHAPRYVACG